MKKISYGVLVLFLLLVCGVYTQAAHKSAEQSLVAALEAAGVNSRQISVNGWTQLSEEDYPDEILAEIVNNAMQKLGANVGEYDVTTNSSIYHTTIRADKVVDGYHAVVMAQVLHGIGEKKYREVYLVINLESTHAEDATTVCQQKISNIITDLGSYPRITTCLVGWFDGKLDTEHWVSTINKAFQAMDATVVDSVVNANYASYTGYTSNIEENIKVGTKRINLHMAIRYSSYDNRTYVILGSPIITGEY